MENVDDGRWTDGGRVFVYLRPIVYFRHFVAVLRFKVIAFGQADSEFTFTRMAWQAATWVVRGALA